MIKESKLQFKNAVIANDEALTIIEYDNKGEVVNEMSLLEAFKSLASDVAGTEGITFTIQAKKEENEA